MLVIYFAYNIWQHQIFTDQHTWWYHDNQSYSQHARLEAAGWWDSSPGTLMSLSGPLNYSVTWTSCLTTIFSFYSFSSPQIQQSREPCSACVGGCRGDSKDANPQSNYFHFHAAFSKNLVK